MNRLLISVLLITLLQTKVFAQEYYPIDTSNVVWNELKETASGDTYPPDKFIETYSVGGDTIIDSHRFYKIYLQESNDSSYVGCFREEDKRIYYTGVDYFGFETVFMLVIMGGVIYYLLNKSSRR